MRIIITGGAGFIGSCLVKYLLEHTNHDVLNIDHLSYAANEFILDDFESYRRYSFSKTDICDYQSLGCIYYDFKPDAVMHLAAESHVDRSIDGPGVFIQTNIIGTYNLLDISLKYWRDKKSDYFRFHHVSTDEVYGSLGHKGLFTEKTPYKPNSPYSASKASSDHLVRAWHKTYGLPVLVTNSSNNYGSYQFPEKLIPLMIIKALNEDNLPIYGDGSNIRDWLYVEDHVRALYAVLTKGQVGETYNIGGDAQYSNLDVVYKIVDILDELKPSQNMKSRRELITFVDDRPGHDFRYAIDCSKIKNEFGWSQSVTFEQGLRQTIEWYLDHQEWWKAIQAKTYSGERYGIS